MVTVTYFFKKRFIGYSCTSTLVELSIHKGLSGWGLTRKGAMKSLHKKWNKLVARDKERLMAIKDQSVDIWVVEYKITIAGAV